MSRREKALEVIRDYGGFAQFAFHFGILERSARKYIDRGGFSKPMALSIVLDSDGKWTYEELMNE